MLAGEMLKFVECLLKMKLGSVGSVFIPRIEEQKSVSYVIMPTD